MDKYIKTGRKGLVMLGGVLIVLMLISSVSAQGIAYIYGTVTDKESGAPVPGAAVTVTCDGNGNTNSTTSASTDPPGVGHYDLWIECSIGDTVEVYASKDGKSGTDTGAINPSGIADVGISLVDVPIAAPEAAAAIAAIAALAPALAYGLVRRRKKN